VASVSTGIEARPKGAPLIDTENILWVRMSGPPNDLETEPETHAHAGPATDARPRLGLVVLFSSEGPGPVGAFMSSTSSDKAKPRILGRGPARPDDEFVRLALVRQRPNSGEVLGPLENPSLSRSQLVVRPLANGTMHITNVGQCRLFLNGAETTDARGTPGDV